MKQITAEYMGEIFKHYRHQKGLTQYKLAELIEIDERQISKIERGVHYPSVITFIKIVQVLDIDTNIFFTNTPVKFTDAENKLMKILKNSSEKNINLACNILELINKSEKDIIN